MRQRWSVPIVEAEMVKSRYHMKDSRRQVDDPNHTTILRDQEILLPPTDLLHTWHLSVG